jgi:hypothetical protein
MYPVEFHTRLEWYGPGRPVNNDGKTLRPLLDGDRTDPDVDPVSGGITIHYTGVSGAPYAANMDMAKWLANLQKVAVTAGKSFEYNYVVAPRADRAEVWEYAGLYRAAHSEGENDTDIGVLMVLKVGQPVTDAMIEAVRWLRDVYLPPTNVMRQDAVTRQHRQMPGAQTACPGASIIARWTEFLPEYPTVVIPVPPVPPTIHHGSESAMGLFLAEPPVRPFDSRRGASPILADGKPFTIQLPIPADATSAIITITATGAAGPGFMKAWNPAVAEPETSVLNYRNGEDVSSSTLVGVSGGRFNIKVSATTHVLVDYIGYVK